MPRRSHERALEPRTRHQRQRQILLILASTSSYRAQALHQLGLTFNQIDPQVDESPRVAELPQVLAERLARAKANAVVAEHPGAIVIAGDQVGSCEGRMLHKPGSESAAITQLTLCSGARAVFYSAIAVWDPQSERMHTDVVPTHLVFRSLSAAQITSYVARDQPLACAGSFMIERLGIALFEKVESSDPSALVGLPLLRLVEFLARCGVDVLSD